MTEAEQVMKRCQIGTRNYDEANNLHADCYRVIGKLLAEHAMQEVQRLGQEIEQEPVAWIHIMDNTEGIRANGKGIISITQKRKHPFGKVGIDFDPSYPIKSTPLYAAQPQRTWVGLTYEDMVNLQKDLHDDKGEIVLPTTFAQAVEAKLKEKNT